MQEIALLKNKNKKLFFDKDLNPSLIVSYKNYFENNNDIRITVDNNIIFLIRLTISLSRIMIKRYLTKELLNLI